MANKETNEAIARNMLESVSQLLDAKLEVVIWKNSSGESGRTIKLTTQDN